MFWKTGACTCHKESEIEGMRVRWAAHPTLSLMTTLRATQCIGSWKGLNLQWQGDLEHEPSSKHNSCFKTFATGVLVISLFKQQDSCTLHYNKPVLADCQSTVLQVSTVSSKAGLPPAKQLLQSFQTDLGQGEAVAEGKRASSNCCNLCVNWQLMIGDNQASKRNV